MKMEAFDRLNFYQNYRQPYTVIPITTVRGPLDIIVSDFQNNDKRKFWKLIRHFVKKKQKQFYFFYSSFMFSTFKR